MILKNPWGFGADQGAAALGYLTPAGEITLDSYYLTIGLDYGVAGFIAFYGMLLAAIYLCVRVYLTSSESEARIAAPVAIALGAYFVRSEEHTSELQSLMRISYAVFCLKKKNKQNSK